MPKQETKRSVKMGKESAPKTKEAEHRSLETLLLQCKEVGPAEVAKGLTDHELALLISEGKPADETKKQAAEVYSRIRGIVLQHAIQNNWKFKDAGGGITAEVSPSSKYNIGALEVANHLLTQTQAEPIEVAQFILSNFPKDRIRNVFNAVFRIDPLGAFGHLDGRKIEGKPICNKETIDLFNSIMKVGLTEAKRYLGEATLDALGGEKEVNEFSGVKFK